VSMHLAAPTCSRSKDRPVPVGSPGSAISDGRSSQFEGRKLPLATGSSASKADWERCHRLLIEPEDISDAVST